MIKRFFTLREIDLLRTVNWFFRDPKMVPLRHCLSLKVYASHFIKNNISV